MDSELVNRLWSKCSRAIANVANIECAHYSYTTQVCKQKLGGMHTLLMRTYLICGWLLWNGTHSTHLWWREKYCRKVLVSPVRGPGDTESLTTAPTWDNHQTSSQKSPQKHRGSSPFNLIFKCICVCACTCTCMWRRVWALWGGSCYCEHGAGRGVGFFPSPLCGFQRLKLCEASAISYKPFSSHNHVLWDRELSSIWNLPVRLGQLANKSHLTLFSALGF